MPYPNEHACRLEPPGSFEKDSFKRTKRKSGGKEYSIIMGKKKGSDAMSEQAYRYPKDKWSAADAKKHCGDKKGSFEAAANNVEFNWRIDNVQTRMETFEGKKHIVAPVVMLVEGVHDGSFGALYYPPEELAEFPQAWNGVPVTIDHPKDVNGWPSSANDPKIIEAQSTGRLWNVGYEDGKLKGEIWIDVSKAEKLAPDILAKLQNDRQIEVSTGLFIDPEITAGMWNDEEYSAIARDFRPDHLAILPEGVGACSWADGCGIRNESTSMIDHISGDIGGSAIDYHWPYYQQEYTGPTGPVIINTDWHYGSNQQKEGGDKGKDKYLNPFFNEKSHGQIRSMLFDMIKDEAGIDYQKFVVDVFDKYFIYADESGKFTKLFRQDYSVDSDDNISLIGQPVEVEEKREYVAITSNKGAKKMGDKICCPEKVVALIANEATPFTDEQKEWLETLTEDQLDLITPAEPEEIDHFAAIDWDGLSEDQIETVKSKLGLNVADETPDGDDSPETMDEVIANAPAELQDTLKTAVKKHEAERSGMVEAILGNKRNKFTKEQLEAKDFEELEALVELGKSAPPDYTGNEGGQDDQADDEVLEMPAL